MALELQSLQPSFKFGDENSDGVCQGDKLYAICLITLTDSGYDLTDIRENRLGIVSFALILGILGTILFMVSSFRERVKGIDTVIYKLKNGDLNARVPIKGLDEFGMMMIRFNQMADEIQRIVFILKKTDAARTVLLSELAHDLRTPIASVKTLLETLEEKSDLLTVEKRKHLLSTCTREIEYFSNLVEDLLFLSQMSEPKYMKSKEPVDLHFLIADEILLFETTYPEIRVRQEVNIDEPIVMADGGLLKRLVRNILENAFSFAKSRVDIRVKVSKNGTFHLIVSDDGPGFTEEDFTQYGQRKFSRAVVAKDTKRISVGLGSVIIKSIVDAYGGQLLVENIFDGNQKRKGARVTISLFIE